MGLWSAPPSGTNLSQHLLQKGTNTYQYYIHIHAYIYIHTYIYIYIYIYIYSWHQHQQLHPCPRWFVVYFTFVHLPKKGMMRSYVTRNCVLQHLTYNRRCSLHFEVALGSPFYGFNHPAALVPQGLLLHWLLQHPRWSTLARLLRGLCDGLGLQWLRLDGGWLFRKLGKTPCPWRFQTWASNPVPKLEEVRMMRFRFPSCGRLIVRSWMIMIISFFHYPFTGRINCPSQIATSHSSKMNHSPFFLVNVISNSSIFSIFPTFPMGIGPPKKTLSSVLWGGCFCVHRSVGFFHDTEGAGADGRRERREASGLIRKAPAK